VHAFLEICPPALFLSRCTRHNIRLLFYQSHGGSSVGKSRHLLSYAGNKFPESWDRFQSRHEQQRDQTEDLGHRWPGKIQSNHEVSRRDPGCLWCHISRFLCPDAPMDAVDPKGRIRGRAGHHKGVQLEYVEKWEKEWTSAKMTPPARRTGPRRGPVEPSLTERPKEAREAPLPSLKLSIAVLPGRPIIQSIPSRRSAHETQQQEANISSEITINLVPPEKSGI
jgi:hypothetical protein